MLVLNGKPLPYDRAFTHENIQYPSSWLRLTSLEEKQAIGISEVPDEPSYDQRFYFGPSNPKQLDDKTETINGTEIKSIGLKTSWSSIQNDVASTTLATSDWRVIKAKETSTDIPTDWETYRAAVRAVCNTRQAEITACTTVEQLKELLFGPAEVVKTKEQQQIDADGNGVVDEEGKAVMETVIVTEERPLLDDEGNAVVDNDGKAVTYTVNVMIANPGVATAWPTSPA